MKKNALSSCSVIIVELGAEWPRSARVASQAQRVFAQLEQESMGDFTARVGQGLSALSAAGIAVGQAIMACSERLDEFAAEARKSLARAATAALAAKSGGVLHVSVSDRNQGRSRAHFAIFGRELSEKCQKYGVEVRLAFADEAEAVLAIPAGTRVGMPRALRKHASRRVA